LENAAMSLIALGILPTTWLAAVMSGTTIAILLVLFGLVALLIISAKQRMLPWQGPRIRIGPKEKIKFRVEGIRKYKCPACWSEIREGDPMIRCTIDPAHRIHRDCRELVQDKCPQCKGKLE